MIRVILDNTHAQYYNEIRVKARKEQRRTKQIRAHAFAMEEKMKRTKRLVAALLVLIMTFSCFSCDGGTASVESGEDAADTAFESERDAAIRVYTEAAEALEKKTDRNAWVKVKLDKKTGDAEYEEEYEYFFEYSGIGTDSYIAQVSTKAVLAKTVIKSTETFSSGVATYEIDGDDRYYFTEITSEDYSARHIPAVLFTPEVYTSIEYDTDKGKVVFSEASSVESWAAPESARVLSAAGSVSFSAEGVISAMTYEAEFVQGTVSIKAKYEVEVGEGSLSADDLAKPVTEKKVAVDDIDAPMAIKYAYDMLEAGFGTNGKRTDYIYSFATGIEMTSETVFANRGKTADAVAKITESTVVRSSQGGNVSSESELVYRDGGVTYSENGSEPSAADGYTLDDVLAMIEKNNEYNLTDRKDMNNITSEHLPDYLILNFDLPTDYGALVENTVSESLFGDKDYLDSYASSYTTDSLKAYLCIDKDSGFITGSGVEYEGAHVIAEQRCPLIYRSNSVCKMADPAAYTEVTGEPVPSAEPQEKPTPAFYVVTSPEGRKMYLLGTIHVGDNRMLYLPEEITDALASSDALALEVNNDTLEQRLLSDANLMAAYSEGVSYQDGSTNKTKLPESAYAALRKIAKVYGDTVYTELYYPSVIASRYELKLLSDCGAVNHSMGAEELLTDIAKEKGVDVIEVEEIFDRLKLDSKYSDALQLYLLDAAATSLRAEALADTMQLYELWCEGDEAKLREAIEEDPLDEDADAEEMALYEEYERILMTERDAQMIEKAKEYLASDKTVFFAVGAAHVLGEGGIVDSLRASGYTVEKVEYK